MKKQEEIYIDSDDTISSVSSDANSKIKVKVKTSKIKVKTSKMKAKLEDTFKINGKVQVK